MQNILSCFAIFFSSFKLKILFKVGTLIPPLFYILDTFEFSRQISKVSKMSKMNKVSKVGKFSKVSKASKLSKVTK